MKKRAAAQCLPFLRSERHRFSSPAKDRPISTNPSTARTAHGAKVPPATVIIVPGWRDSGPGHWQSLWAERMQNAVRVVQDDWVTPTREAWVGTLEKLVLASPDPVVIVAHSLGCIATAHLPAAAAARIRGALLVAPADPERRAVLSDFSPVPYAKLPYRSALVDSNN